MTTMVTGLVLGLFMLYDLFLQLTAELKGCDYYCSIEQLLLYWSYIPYSAPRCLLSISNILFFGTLKLFAKYIKSQISTR